MKKTAFIIFGMSLMVSLASYAGTRDKGGPGPLIGSNQKVELADGEFYILSGMIVIGPSQTDSVNIAYLKVDLNKQSWLANARREEVPYYPIDIDPTLLAAYDHKNVKLSCTAEAKIVTLTDGTQTYIIYLRPVERSSKSSKALRPAHE